MIYNKLTKENKNNQNTFRKFRNNLILVQKENFEKTFYHVPLGIDVNKYSKLEINKNQVKLIDGPEGFLDEIVISPKVQKFDDNLFYGVAYTEEDYIKCLDIIQKEHYLSAVPNGLLFYVKDKSVNNGEILSCLTLSRLTYGNPKRRKTFLQEHEGIPRENEEQSRNFAKENIAWISRIATKKEFQGKGYGKLICEKLPLLLKQLLPNPPKYIEVMTSWDKDSFYKKYKINDLQKVSLNEENDFLIQAEYERVYAEDKDRNDKSDGGWISYIKRLKRENSNITNIKEQVVRYYYVKKTK